MNDIKVFEDKIYKENKDFIDIELKKAEEKLKNKNDDKKENKDKK